MKPSQKKRSFSVVAKDPTNGVKELLRANRKKRPALKSENWSQQMKFWWLFLCALLQRRVIARRWRDRQTAGNLRVHTFQFLNCQFTKCTQTKCKKNEKWISMICWEKWPCCGLDSQLSSVHNKMKNETRKWGQIREKGGIKSRLLTYDSYILGIGVATNPILRMVILSWSLQEL